MNPAPQKPTTTTASGPTAMDLLSMVTDETLRQQIQQQAIDQFSANRASLATGIPSPRIELQLKYGRAYGFNEIQSIEWIYLFPMKDGQFKPMLDYKGRAFLLKKSGYDWRPLVHNGTKAEFVFYRDGVELQDATGKPLTICWTIERATKAGLVARARGSSKEPDGTYDKYPERMLFAKVIHDFGAMYAQEVSGAGMIDKFDGPSMDEIVEATAPMQMPKEIVKETVDANNG